MKFWTTNNPTNHPTNTGFRIDTLGKPNDAYTLRCVGRVAEVSRNHARKRSPEKRVNAKQSKIAKT